MKFDFSWEPPLRLFHLSGGVGCLSDQSGLCVLLAPGAPPRVWSNISSGTTPSVLAKLEPLRVLARVPYNSIDEMKDPVTWGFCTSITDQNNQSLGFHQQERWRGLSRAVAASGFSATASIADALANQIRLCTGSLELLISAYKTALHLDFRISNRTRPDAQKWSLISNKYSYNIGLRVQSLLNELFGLRDFILKFVYAFHYNGKNYSYRKLKTIIETDQSLPAAHLILTSMHQEQPLGAIALMSLYRNVFLHYLTVNGTPFGSSYFIRSTRGPLGTVPYIQFPLYDRVDLLALIEKGKLEFLDTGDQAEAERFMKLPRHLDALEFCFDCFTVLLQLSHTIESNIAIKSDAIIITDKDIAEAKLISSDGKLTKLRSNGQGGLEEYQ